MVSRQRMHVPASLGRRARRVVAMRGRSTTPLPHPADDDAPALPVMLSSHRVTSAARLRMLHLVTAQLGEQLRGSGMTVHVADASDERWHREARRAWEGTGLDVRVLREPVSLATAYAAMLGETASSTIALQFDDTISVGLSTSWLSAASALVERYDGQIVVAPQWPVEIRRERDIEVVPHRARRDGRRRHWLGGWQRPVAVDTINGHSFAIFRNFVYGFHFNNLVADTKEFARRLAWYRDHVHRESVHAIELAGFAWRGPVWSHIAIPGDVALLDLDYEHTSAAVRPGAPGREGLCELLESGSRPIIG